MSQQINLFDATFRPQKPHFAAVTMLWAFLALALLMLFIQQLYAYQNRTLEATLADTEKRAAHLRGETLRFAREFGERGRGGALADELARVEQQLRLRRSLLEGIHGGASVQVEGFSPYLAALARQTLPGLWLTGIEIAGPSGDLALKGRVLEGELVPLYIQRLKREPLLAGRVVRELRLAAKDEAGRRYVEFSLRIPLAREQS